MKINIIAVENKFGIAQDIDILKFLLRKYMKKPLVAVVDWKKSPRGDESCYIEKKA